MHTSSFPRRLIHGLSFPVALVAASAQISLRAQDARPAPAPTTDYPSISEPGDETVKMEALSVTGTNIKRLDAENVLPVTVFDQAAMDLRNAVTPAEMLTALPLVTNMPQNEATNGGAGVRGDAATVNLRGIGAGNTLVLLNGRRLAPHPITAADSGQNAFYVNVNQLPTQGIARIDVLRDGASSIYGSDAVAGVINYVMRHDFRGTEVRTRWGVPEEGGGQTLQGTLTFGQDFDGGKGRVMMVADFLYRDAIYLRDRDFTANANHTLQVALPSSLSSPFDGKSATGFFPTFSIGSSSATNYFRPLAGAGSIPSFTTAAPTRAANPEYYLNTNNYQMGSPRSDRFNWYGNIEYNLTPKLTVFSDLSFYRAKTALVRQPIALNAPAADMPKPLSVDNPYNPYGSHFYDINGAPNADGTPRLTGTPQTITLLSGTLPSVDPEHIQITSDVYRIVSGIRGKLFDTWTWECGVLYSRAADTDLSRDAIRESALAAALSRTDANAYDPFGYTFKVSGNAVVADKPYRNPPSALGFVQEWRHEGFSSIGSIDFHTAGQLVDLWAGPIALAVGGEFRKEEFIDKRPPFSGLNPPGSGLALDDNDFVTASPTPDSHGDRTIGSAYAETVIPLTRPENKLPWLNSLELTSSARFEHYSDFGDTTRPKVGVNWKPVKSVMIRASFNEGFTAPNLPTLYAPSLFRVDTQPGQLDPYRSQFTGEGPYVQRAYSIGNPNLQPTTSIGKSVGAVIEVPQVKGLTFSADYWQIEQQNVINSLTTSQILSDDASRLNQYLTSQLAAGKTLSQIDLGSGTSDYKGSPFVVRHAVTSDDQAIFAAYNATHPNAPAAPVGLIISRNSVFENLAKGYVSGWDLSANYEFSPTAWGHFSLNSDWSYLIRSYLTKSVPGQPSSTQERLNVDGTTRWRGTTTLTWRRADWSAGLSAYYIGRYSDSTATSITATSWAALGQPSFISKTFDSNIYVYRYVVHDTWSYNTYLQYRLRKSQVVWLSNTSIRLGVINLFNKEPPLTPGVFGYSPSVYESLLPGRTWTLEFTKQF